MQLFYVIIANFTSLPSIIFNILESLVERLPICLAGIMLTFHFFLGEVKYCLSGAIFLEGVCIKGLIVLLVLS